MRNNKKDYDKKKNKEHEPNDGTFISYKKSDEFNTNGSTRYGIEQDSCDV